MLALTELAIETDPSAFSDDSLMGTSFQDGPSIRVGIPFQMPQVSVMRN
jgi:hypothetical protein